MQTGAMPQPQHNYYPDQPQQQMQMQQMQQPVYGAPMGQAVDAPNPYM